MFTLKIKFHCIIALWLSSFAIGQISDLDRGANIQIFRVLFKELALNAFGSTSAGNSRHLYKARQQRRVQYQIPDDEPFPCNVSAGRSKSVPISVHKLRPGDIDIIGAMGDSLTAGTGAIGTNIFHLAIENRGVTVFGGGQRTWREYLTIPNIIKAFNPDLIGHSPSDSSTHQEASELNVADLAALSRDLPFMAEILVRRMKSHPRVDMKHHWKNYYNLLMTKLQLVNIFIGHNDFCSEMCYLPSGPWSILNSHRTELIEALRILKKNLPRTLVSIIPPVNVNIIASLKNKPLICAMTTLIECSCLVGLQRQAQLDELTKIIARWQEIDEEIAMDPEFQTEDFAVVAQPFMTNISFPTKLDGSPDWRYLSTDCFHLSQIGNARVTLGAWANMLEPVGKKSRKGDLINTLMCPTESRPYIATAGNS